MKRKTPAKYSNDQLLRAIQAVKEGSTQFAAARTYGVPRSTLYNKVTGKSQVGKKSGPGTVLAENDEKYIEKWLICLAERGFPVVKRQLLQSIQHYLNANKRETPFTDNYPGRKWYNNFLQRHPIISKRMSQNLIKSRASVTENKLKFWHAEVTKYCEDNELSEALSDPTRVFNVDEKGFILTPRNEVVLAKKGQKAVYNRNGNDEKECVTALLGGSAAGMATPPMLVFAYKRMPSNILLNLPPEWSVGISDNGWQTQQTFYDYVSNVFYKWLLDNQIKFPVILFIDGHKSHISLKLSDFCSANGIQLVALYPNATHVIQPMDVVIFKPLGASWDEKLKDWKIKHQYAKIDKKDIAPILDESIRAIDYSGLLKKGFERCGLHPFDVANINFSRLVPVAAAEEQDKFFDDGKSLDPEPEETEQSKRLKSFEELLDVNIVNAFRSSNGEWRGSIEYGEVYRIWKKFSADASSIRSSEEESFLTIDVETLDPHTLPTNSSGECIAEIFVVGDDGQLLKSADVDCIAIDSNDMELGESFDFGLCDLVEFDDDQQAVSSSFRGAESQEIVMFDEQSNTGGSDAMNEGQSQIILKLPEKLSDGNENNSMETETSAVWEAVESATPIDIVVPEIQVHTDQFVTSNEVISSIAPTEVTSSIAPTEVASSIAQTANTKAFDKEIFKKSFLMPQLIESKKKTNLPKDKPSTVITSEAWKESERKKLEEKLAKEAEKDARKIERERKKCAAAELKAQKEKAKEQKKLQKAEKDASKIKTVNKTKKKTLAARSSRT